MRHPGYRLLLACSVLSLASAAAAGETVTYSYDALGRLTATSTTGTVNNGVATGIGYDPAGNRSSYAVTGAEGGAPPPPPSPPPPPPPSPPPPPPANNPPTAVADSGAQPICSTASYAVLANDSDVDGDYPLSLVSVTGVGFAVASTTEIEFTSTSSIGSKVGTYTVRDSRGATATGTLNVAVSGGTCNQLALASPSPAVLSSEEPGS